MYSVEVVLTSSLIVGRRPKNCGANQLSYRHAVRRTRKGQWEKRPAYPKASKQWGKTPSIPQGEQGSGKNAQHTQGEQGSGRNTQHTQGEQILIFRGLNLIIPTKPT